MPIDSCVPLPPPRNYTRRVDDLLAAEIDALRPGDSIFISDPKTVPCVLSRMKAREGWVAVRRREDGGTRIWRKE